MPAITYSADIKKAKGDPILAVVYARYSSHNQTEQSIEGQFAAAHQYAAAKGYTIVKEYADRAQTGRNDNREAFQQMLSDTAKKQFDVIITWKVDRIGRNREEIAFNKHTCKKHGIRIEYVKESIPDGPEGVILESVLEGVAEYYSLQMSQNIGRGMLASAQKQQYIGGTIPLGYRVDEKKKFQLDPVTAPIAKQIFERYAAGETESEIIRWLNESGVQTARQKPFTKSSLAKLLHNEKYIGIYSYKDLIRVEGGVPALIPVDTFNKVQEMLKVNRRAPSHKWTHIEYILTDKLFCGHCGAAMIGASGFSKNGAKYSYYACVNQRRHAGCSKRPVRQDLIEKAVLDYTVQLLQDQELLEFIADKTYEYYLTANQQFDEKEALEKQLAEVEKATSNLIHAAEMGMFNAAVKARMDELDQQKINLTAAIADIELSHSFKLTRDHILYFLTKFRDADLTDPECQKRLIQTFINAVFVYDDGTVKIVYNYTSDNNTVTLSIARAVDNDANCVRLLRSTLHHSDQRRTPIIIFGSTFMVTVHLKTDRN